MAHPVYPTIEEGEVGRVREFGGASGLRAVE
jgi:hypothetical protein